MRLIASVLRDTATPDPAIGSFCYSSTYWIFEYTTPIITPFGLRIGRIEYEQHIVLRIQTPTIGRQ